MINKKVFSVFALIFSFVFIGASVVSAQSTGYTTVGSGINTFLILNTSNPYAQCVGGVSPIAYVDNNGDAATAGNGHMVLDNEGRAQSNSNPWAAYLSSGVPDALAMSQAQLTGHENSMFARDWLQANVPLCSATPKSGATSFTTAYNAWLAARSGGNPSGTNPDQTLNCQTGDTFDRVTGVRCSGANSSNPPTGTNTPPAGTTPNLISGTNTSVSITATPGTFANGKWTYTFVWNRARDAQGTFIVTPVSSPNTITLKVDPAAKNNSSIPATAQLDPSTAYLAEYYNLPQCSKTDIDCVVIASSTFTTLSSTGTPPAPTSNNNGNNSNSSDISSLQAQINALTAQIAQLIALIAGNGITPVSGGGNTNLPVFQNIPAGATCTGSISAQQSADITRDHNNNRGNSEYNVTTSTGNVTCRYGATPSTPANLSTHDNPNGYDLSQQFSAQAGVYMVMRANDEGYNGPSDAPEPILIMRNGKKYGNTQAEIIANPDPNNTRVLEAYASVGSNFLSGIHYYIPSTELCENNPRVKIEGPTSPNVPGLTWHNGPDKTQTYYDKGSCTFGWWNGSPTTPGRYVFEYKITSNLGSVQKVTTTKINIVVKRTSIFDMSIVPNTSYKADGTASTGPVIGGRSLITWDQNNLLRGNTTFDRMNLYVAPGDQSGKDPRYITNKYVIDEDTNEGLRIVGACNSTASGGPITAENPNSGYGCGRYNWLVGSTRGQNLAPGQYTLFVAPYIPVLDRDNLVPIMYTNSDDNGAAYGYGSVVVNIGAGTLPAVATGTPGDFGFLRGGIKYVRKNSSQVEISRGTAEYGLGRGLTISVDPTDTLELEWSGYFPSARSCVLINTANGSLCKQVCDMSGCHDDTFPVAQMDNAGTAWSSGIRITNGVTNYEVATLNALRARVATAFPNIPGGFDNVGTSGFMNTPSGKYTITGDQMQRLQGLGFSLTHTVWNGLYGCTNCTSITASMYVNVGVGSTTHEIGLGNANTTGLTTSAGAFNTDACRLPDTNNMSAAVNPGSAIFTLENGRNEGIGYDSYTTAFANLLRWNDVAGNPYKFTKLEFSVGTNPAGCSGSACVVNRTVMDLAANNLGVDSTGLLDASTPNRTGAQFVGGLQNNTTYYNKLKYTCAGVSGSRELIWPVTTTGPGSIIQQNATTITRAFLIKSSNGLATDSTNITDLAPRTLWVNGTNFTAGSNLSVQISGTSGGSNQFTIGPVVIHDSTQLSVNITPNSLPATTSTYTIGILSAGNPVSTSAATGSATNLGSGLTFTLGH